jgi:hypothetical protein
MAEPKLSLENLAPAIDEQVDYALDVWERDPYSFGVEINMHLLIPDITDETHKSIVALQKTRSYRGDPETIRTLFPLLDANPIEELRDTFIDQFSLDRTEIIEIEFLSNAALTTQGIFDSKGRRKKKPSLEIPLVTTPIDPEKLSLPNRASDHSVHTPTIDQFKKFLDLEEERAGRTGRQRRMIASYFIEAYEGILSN